MSEIAVTIHGRKRVLELHRWREQIDHSMWAIVLRCETINSGRAYAFECFMLIEPARYHLVIEESAEAVFLQELAKRNHRHMDPFKHELPFIADLRRES